MSGRFVDNLPPPDVQKDHGIFKGDKGDPGDANAVYAAALALSGHRVMRVRDDGRVEYADAGTSAHRLSIAGLSLNAAAEDGDVTVMRSGVVTLVGWGLTPGANVFLGSNGVLTHATPSAPAAAFLLRIGVALTADSLFVDPGEPILLSGA